MCSNGKYDGALANSTYTQRFVPKFSHICWKENWKSQHVRWHKVFTSLKALNRTSVVRLQMHSMEQNFLEFSLKHIFPIEFDISSIQINQPFWVSLYFGNFSHKITGNLLDFDGCIFGHPETSSKHSVALLQLTLAFEWFAVGSSFHASHTKVAVRRNNFSIDSLKWSRMACEGAFGARDRQLFGFSTLWRFRSRFFSLQLPIIQVCGVFVCLFFRVHHFNGY